MSARSPHGRALGLLFGVALLASGALLAQSGAPVARRGALLLHLAVGVVGLPALIWAARGHAEAQRAARGAPASALSWAVAALGGLAALSGLVLLAPVLGAPALPLGAGRAHGLAGLVLGLAAVAHAAQALEGGRRRPGRRGAALRAAAAVLLSGLALGGGAALVGVALDPRPAAPAGAWSQTPARSSDGALIRAEALAGSETCAACHPAIAEQWRESMHRYAATDEHVAAGIRWFQQTNGVEAGQHCAGCHDPIQLLAGMYQEGLSTRAEGTPGHAEGVSCLACHAIADLHRAPLANGSYRIEAPAPAWAGVIGEALVAADLDAHRRALGRPILRDPALCGSCHQQHLPQLTTPTEAQLEQQYAEWRRSSYADPASSEAKSCVDCHMPLVEAEDPAAQAGKVRSHRMPGANHAHATKVGHPAQAEAVLAMLREGLRLELQPRLDAAAGVIEVAVTLHNDGVGHNFPSGATDISEAWVEVVVGDPDAPLAAVGQLRADHTLAADTPIWRRVLLDANGLVVDLHDLRSVRSVLEDRSVPPKGSDTVRHRLLLPADASGTLPVRARLQLRKANQRWNGWLFNFDGRTTPVVTIHEEHTTIALPAGWAEGAAATPAPGRLVAPLPTPPPGMVAIPGGLFRMGLPDGEPDEGPVHGRRLRAFAIDRTPVTAGEAAAALRGKGLPPPRLLLPWAARWSWTSAGPPPGTEGAPAILLTREEAAMVCAARGARLPTEPEWELAARGYEGRRYPWGEDPTPPPCPAADGADVPPAVGLCPERASPFGVLDMVGGVLEWTADAYLAYPDPLLDNNANEWVVTFAPDAAAVRGSPAGRRGPATTAAARTGQNPYQRGRVGFRCARALEG